jgi:hypothetical protein
MPLKGRISNERGESMYFVCRTVHGFHSILANERQKNAERKYLKANGRVMCHIPDDGINFTGPGWFHDRGAI